jgi:hypothetical protein
MFTPEWLTAVLCKDVPGARVLSFELGTASSGSTDQRAFTVTYNEAGARAGLPTHLFNKCSKGFRTRLMMLQCGTLINECEFYARIRPELDIEAPKVFNVSFDRKSWRSSIILEDIFFSKKARILNALTKIDRPRIESLVKILASVHARYWDSPRLLSEFTWLRTPIAWLDHVEHIIKYEERGLVGIERSSAVIPAPLLAKSKLVYPALRASMQASSEGPLTFLHGDPHIGNYYVTGAGESGVVDWQVNFRGGWGHDLAYTMLSALDIEDRRAWERDLIALYVDTLKEQGVASPPSLEQAWDLYRKQTLYTYVGWLYTIGFGPLQPSMQPDELSMKVIERSAVAVEDLQSMQALGF